MTIRTFYRSLVGDSKLRKESSGVKSFVSGILRAIA
jgi:hypothetical protein